jgi:hypothetical protein
MASDQTKLCAIINNSGKDIVVAIAINDDETSSQDAVLSDNQQVEILKTSSGDTIIKNGNSNTVTLDHNYKDGADESGYVQDYNLIVSDSAWLYPLADLPVVQQGTNGSASYPPQTVDEATQASISQAFGFYQTFAAYPSSQLAKSYIAALQQAQDAASAAADGSPDSPKAVANAIDNAMDSFFSGTDQYKDVTLADVVAVDNYYNNLPFVWAQYQDSIIYYLYGTDGTTAVFSGTLSLVKSGPVDITQPNGGYTCSFEPAVNPSDTSKTDIDTTRLVNLRYSNGLFLDDPTVDTPAIGLKGSFMLERLFTNDPNDNAVIVVLTGTVNGMTCIGFDIPQPAQPKTTSLQTSTPTALSGSQAENYWNTLIHPKGQQDLIISILTFAGAILLIPATAFAIYGIYRFVRYKQQVKEPAFQAETESKRHALTESRRESIERGLKQTGTPVDGSSGDESLDNTAIRIEGDLRFVLNKQNVLELLDAFEMQQVCLQQGLKYREWLNKTSIQLIQDSLRSIKDSVTKLLAAADSDAEDKSLQLQTALDDAKASFSTVKVNLDQVNAAINRKLNEQEKEIMDRNMAGSTKIVDDLQSSTEKEKEEEADTNPGLEGKIVPEEFSFVE